VGRRGKKTVGAATALTRTLGAASLVVLCVAGCTQSPEAPTPSPSTASATASTQPALALLPEGSASDNKAFFDDVNARTASNQDVGGRDFLDGLVAAGFDKGAMEVTKDATTLGDRAESIQFSVRWGDECLIGQFGPAVGGYHSTVQPVLDTGRCLIGETRPIDW
jgi:hypothetical protein